MVEFTVEEAIAIQTKQLTEWKKLLKPKVYLWVENMVIKENHLAKNGYQIIRGQSIDTIVSNYNYYNSKTK